MNNSHMPCLKPPTLRWFLLFILLVIVIIVPFLLFEAQVEKFINQTMDTSMSRLSLAMMIGTALVFDVILPIPSSMVNTVAGAALGFAFGTFVCWFGMTLGCLFGYWIGATGGTAVVRRLLGDQELERAENIAFKLGFATLMLMRAVPVFAEASTIAAGAARYPISKFLPIVSIANLGIAAAYAGIGAFAWSADSFLLVLAGAIGIPMIVYVVYRAAPQLRRAANSARGVASARASDVALASTSVDTPKFSIEYSYPVVFTRGVFRTENLALTNTLAGECEKPARCVVFLDSGVAKFIPELSQSIEHYFAIHSNALQLLDAPLVLPGGEAIKNGFQHLPMIYEVLQRNGIDRHAYVIAVGGGAVLDAVGFAAATAHRGIRHVRIPTTVLSQNDSGVGVKNAVNFNGLKNYVGTFSPPTAVLNDLDFLTALSDRERISGISEAVKVALIRDRDFFSGLKTMLGHSSILNRRPRNTWFVAQLHCI